MIRTRTGGSLARLGFVVFAVAWTTRTMLALIGAASAEVESTLGEGGAAVGLVSTVFVVCAALAAIPAVRLARRHSIWEVVAAALMLIALAHLVLPFAGVPGIWLAVILSGIGGGMIGAITPALVSALLPEHVGIGVGVFMTGSSVGFYLASVTVPATIAWGAMWAFAALPYALAAGVILLLWWFQKPALAAPRPTDSRPAAIGSSLSGTPVWVIVLIAFLCVQSVSIFALIAWLSPSLVAVGMTPAEAANMLGLLSALQVVSGIALPLLAQAGVRVGVLMVSSALGVLFGTAVLWACVGSGELGGVLPGVLVLALGHGGSFAMANYIVARYAPDSASAIRFGASMMLWSQLAGAFGPFAIGVLRDLSGSYLVPWLALTVVGLSQVVCAVVLARQGILRRRHSVSTEQPSARR